MGQAPPHGAPVTLHSKGAPLLSQALHIHPDRLTTYAVAWVILMWGLKRLRGAWPKDWRASASRHGPLLAVLALFSLLVWAVPDWVPAHEHNTFVARSDCARSLRCQEVRGSWSAPTFHLMGLLLRLVPSSPAGRAALSLLLSLAGFGFAYGAMGRFFRRFCGMSATSARTAATWGVGLAALHPALLRITTAGDFWPYNLALLWAATWAALRGRDTGSLFDLVAAYLLLALATLGNLVDFILGPLPLLVALGWFGARPSGLRLSKRHAVLTFAALFYLGWVGTYIHRFLTAGPSGAGGMPDVWRGVAGVWQVFTENHLLLMPATSSPLLAGLLLVGGWQLLRRTRPRLALAPLLYGTLALEWALSNDVSSLQIGYPTRFHNGHATFFLFTPWLGLGALHVVGWLRARWPTQARWAPAGLVVVLVLSTAVTAWESWRFLLEPRILGVEVAQIERLSHRLPPHDVLVVPPIEYAPLPGVRWQQDGLEVQFPVADYRAAMRASGQEPGFVVTLGPLLAGDFTPKSSDRVLFYLGSSLRSFGQNEVASGRVPDDLRRPVLRALLRRWRLEPVLTYELATAQHRLARMRLGADQVPSVRLGFYWLRKK